MPTSRRIAPVWILAIVLCSILVFGCVGTIFAAFYDYKAGSSGPHTINKIGYTEVTTPVATDIVVYPGLTQNFSFTVQNTTGGGTYGTLPIRITNITVSKVEIENVNGNTIQLDNNVVSVTVSSYTTTTINAGGTGTVSGSLTVASPATYSSSSRVNVNTTGYLTNQASKIIVTFLFEVREVV